MAVHYAAHRGPQAFWAYEAKRCFHTELLVQNLLRIADHQERDILLVRADRFRRGMDHDYLLDARRFDVWCALPEFGDMCVANRTLNKPPKLQVDEALGIGEVDRLPSYGFHRRRRKRVCLACISLLSPRDCCEYLQ